MGKNKIINGVEHTQDERGNWVPSTPGEAIRDQVIGAGTSLWNMLSAPTGGSPKRQPKGATLGSRINFPKAPKETE